MKAILWDVKYNLLNHNGTSKIIQKTKCHLLCHFHSMRAQMLKAEACTQKVMRTMWFLREHTESHVHDVVPMWTSVEASCAHADPEMLRDQVWPGSFPYTRFRAVLHSCDFKFQSHVANVYLQCYSGFLSHTFWLCVCVRLNKILGADTQLRKARKQTCKDTQWNVRGLAGMFTIKNKLYHIMTGKVN